MNYVLLLTKLVWVLPPLNEQTVAFYAGELGLLLVAVCGMGIMQAQAKREDRPEWYYFVFVWLVSVSALIMFSRPFYYRNHNDIPPGASWFRFILGVEHVLVLVNYYRARHGIANKLSASGAVKLNSILASATVIIGIVVIGGGFLQITGEHTTTPLQEQNGRILRQNTGRIIGIVEVLKKQATADSLEKLQLRAELAANQAKLDKTNAQLSDLTDVVISLKQSIRQLGAVVERSRRSGIVPSLIQPPTPTGLLPLNRVKDVTPTKFDRRGRPVGFEESTDSADSTYYAHHKPE